MKYELFAPINPNYTYQEQILVNRGIPINEIQHYLNTTDDDINDYRSLGEDRLSRAKDIMLDTINNKRDMMVLIDADNDGFTSSALLINWLYDYDLTWAQNHIKWILHEGKQHGLPDTIDKIIDILKPGAAVFIPDASSNDAEELERLHDLDYHVVVLDHHEASNLVSPDIAVIINNQTSDYPNKDFSGVGIVYQFLRYVEDQLAISPRITDDYLDLVASGNLGDVMSLKSIETKHLINKGFEPDNIRNPFIYYMWRKNEFKLGDHITPMGAAFYIVPFVNAAVRSGTMAEKKLIFKSMLNHEALNVIPSNKRGHKLGETEALVEQAIRTATNIKTRQSKAETSSLEKLEEYIHERNLLDHKVILLLMKPGEIDKNIAGLAANRLMSKYQRPVCILTKISTPDGPAYAGSARGCSQVKVDNFKDICEQSGAAEWEVGHQSAFGLCIKTENIDQFLSYTDEVLKDMPSEPIYRVDFIFRANEISPELIFTIGEMEKLWGAEMPEPLIAIRGLQITKDMLSMMASNTMKISLPNGISMIKFKTPDEEYNKLYSENGYVEIDAIVKANINFWNGMRFAQLFLENFEIKGSCAYVF